LTGADRVGEHVRTGWLYGGVVTVKPLVLAFGWNWLDWQLVFILTNYLKVSLHLDWWIVKALTSCSYGTPIPSGDF